ncbi:MAG: septation protein SepH [Actinomycetota bacterium]|nr:septation protein SepH [Actinomycetota bacterium]
MQQLRFTAVHEDGRHLVLTDADGDQEFLVEIDERMRAALRPRVPDRPRHSEQLSPREIQALIRAGENAEDVAAATGWPVDRVQRFQAPIVAEREHVARLARGAHVRGRGADGAAQTLEARVRERLEARGVDPELARWDSTRPEGGRWTVLLTFVAGQRDRRAAWRYEPSGRSVDALDDEARWLSEDEQTLPGGIAGHPLLGGADSGGGVDLMATMRERSRARGRRRKSAGDRSGPAEVPGTEQVPDDLLPLEDLPYDPDTMGPPPAAHGHPSDEGAEGVDQDGPDALGQAGPDSLGEAGPDTVGGANSTLDLEEDYAAETPAETDDQVSGPREATLADFFGDDEDELDDDEGDLDGDDLDGRDDDEELDEDEGDLDGDDLDSDDPRDDELADDDVTDALQPAESEAKFTAAPDASEQPAGPEHPEQPEQSAMQARQVAAEPGDTGAAGGSEPTQQPDEEGAARRKGRTRVPSWDDIMFGARDRR